MFFRVDKNEVINISTKDVNIIPGESNTIGILAQGATYFVYINGKEVDEVTDTTLKSGLIGINTFANINEFSIVEVDNFLYYEPR